MQILPAIPLHYFSFQISMSLPTTYKEIVLSYQKIKNHNMKMINRHVTVSYLKQIRVLGSLQYTVL